MTAQRRLQRAPDTAVPRRPRAVALTFPELFQLPATIDLATAAAALGICTNTAYRLLKRDAFPCSVLRPGWCYRIPTKALLRALDIDEIPVHRADVETGADFAALVG